MQHFFTQPIGRLHYFLGLIVLGILSSAATGFATKSTASEVDLVSILPIAVLFGLLQIIWVYKRLIDFATIRHAQMLLVIPILYLCFSLYIAPELTVGIVANFEESVRELGPEMLIFGILLVANFILGLFLLFKKGDRAVK